MRLTVSRKSLLESLSISSRFTTQKSQLPILGNILLESANNKLSLSATNLEMSYFSSIAAKIQEEGKITVPSRILSEIVANLSSENIEISTEKENLCIKNESFSSKVLGINASDFPRVPSSLGKNAFTVNSDVFVSVLPKVSYSVSSDETRPVLTGILLFYSNDKMTLVSTDGFRLSKYELENKCDCKDFRVVVPKGILSEILRLSKGGVVEFEYNKDDKQIVFKIGQNYLSSRVIEGEFPDYEKIIPTSSKIKISVDKSDLLQGIKLGSVFAKTSSNIVNFVIEGEKLKIVSESSQAGSQESVVDVSVTCLDKEVYSNENKFTIAFNCEFVENYLNSIDGSSVEIGFNDSNSPGLFIDLGDNNLLHLIMPVRI